jgi:hypothetical protein
MSNIINLDDELKKIEDIVSKKAFDYETYDYNDDIVNDYLFDQSSTPAGTTYGLQVVNTGSTPADVTLFGAHGNTYFGNLGAESGISIQALSGYGDYNHFLLSTFSNPVEVVSLRILSTAEQLEALSLNVVETSPYGFSKSNTLPVATFRTEKDYNTTIISVPLRFIICVDNYISFTILDKTTITFIFFVGNRRKLARTLEKRASQPAVIGKTGRSITSRPVSKAI